MLEQYEEQTERGDVKLHFSAGQQRSRRIFYLFLLQNVLWRRHYGSPSFSAAPPLIVTMRHCPRLSHNYRCPLPRPPRRHTASNTFGILRSRYDTIYGVSLPRESDRIKKKKYYNSAIVAGRVRFSGRSTRTPRTAITGVGGRVMEPNFPFGSSKDTVSTISAVDIIINLVSLNSIRCYHGCGCL